ncbi:MAG: hypothetical protein AAF957_26760 [Planctomycetota bacterium]
MLAEARESDCVRLELLSIAQDPPAALRVRSWKETDPEEYNWGYNS